MLKNFRKTYQTLNTVSIDAAALRYNLKLFRKLLPKQAVCPVLKSNAYGHGLTEIASILEKANTIPYELIVKRNSLNHTAHKDSTN